MRSLRPLLLGALLALAPAATRAQSPQLRFDGVNGASAYGYYVGPFSGTLIRPGTAVGLTLFCIDFLNHVAIGQTAPVAITSLAGGALPATRHPGELEAYRKAAWLTTKFAPANQAQWGGIQAAIWEIMTPGSPNGGTSTANATHEAYWLQQANLFVASASYASYDWSRFYVLTDVAAAGRTSEEQATDPASAPADMARAVLGFNEQLERLGELAVVLVVGAMLATIDRLAPGLWVAFALFVVVRPAATMLALVREPLTGTQRRFIAWFGVRGVGSVYYLAYALTHGVSGPAARSLADITLVVIAASILVHGVSVTPMMQRYSARVRRRR